jgi:hypothetical protein
MIHSGLTFKKKYIQLDSLNVPRTGLNSGTVFELHLIKVSITMKLFLGRNRRSSR